MTFRRLRKFAGMALVLTLSGSLTTACADKSSSFDDSEGDSPGDNDSMGDGNNDAGDDDDDDDNDDGSEDEDALARFSVPQISGRYIYAANLETGRVAVVDSQSLRIQVVPVGASPLQVVALLPPSAQEGAAAILHADAAVAILTTDAAGKTSVAGFQGAAGANAVSASGDGRFIVVYHDVDEVAAQGPGSDQEIAIIDRSTGSRYALSVGLHPYAVTFALDGRFLYVHTQDGVSVVDLLALSPTSGSRLVTVMPGAVNPKTAEVVVVPAVNQALVRVGGQSLLYVTDLISGAQVQLELGAVPNDLDVQADTKSVVLTVPGDVDSQLLELGLPATSSTAIARSVLAGVRAGSTVLAATGSRAIVYATEKFEEGESDDDDDPRRRVTIAEKSGGQWLTKQTLFIESTIRAVGVAPDGGAAVLIHDHAPELNPNAPWPYTMLDLRSTPALRKVQSSLAQASRVIFSPEGDVAGLLLRDDNQNVRQIDVVNLRSLVVQSVLLGSPPQDLGYSASTKNFFAGQIHPAGRISFIDALGQQRTLTGFELGSR